MRTRNRRRFRAILFLAVGVAASVLALAASRLHVLGGVELTSVDLRFDVRGKQAPPSNIVVILSFTTLMSAGSTGFASNGAGMVLVG